MTFRKSFPHTFDKDFSLNTNTSLRMVQVLLIGQVISCSSQYPLFATREMSASMKVLTGQWLCTYRTAPKTEPATCRCYMRCSKLEHCSTYKWCVANSSHRPGLAMGHSKQLTLRPAIRPPVDELNCYSQSVSYDGGLTITLSCLLFHCPDQLLVDNPGFYHARRRSQTSLLTLSLLVSSKSTSANL